MISWPSPPDEDEDLNKGLWFWEKNTDWLEVMRESLEYFREKED